MTSVGGGPLSGITVVSIEQAVAMPYATRHLADLGARVIKVERPRTGDFARDYDATVHGHSSYFVWLNRGKQSIVLDLKEPSDCAVLRSLISHADIFTENLAPGAVRRLGFAVDELRDRDPRLITCSLSGYGNGGPYESKKAYDLLIQCEAGVLSITGSPEAPAKVGLSIADICAGMYAYTGILTALYARERTGTGDHVEVAMLDAMSEWMTQPYYYSAHGKRPPRRTGARHASIAPYGPYRCGDGDTLFIGVQNDREWTILCHRILQRPDLIDDPRFVHNAERVVHDELLTSIIEAALEDSTAEAAAMLLDSAGIANARVRTAADLGGHPQLAGRRRWRSIDVPGGTVEALLPPAMLARHEPVMGAVPALGEHTDQIRAELGIDS